MVKGSQQSKGSATRERILRWFAEYTWIRSLPWTPARDLVFDRAILEGTAAVPGIRGYDTPATTPEEIGARTLGMTVAEFLVWAEDPWARSGCPRPAELPRVVVTSRLVRRDGQLMRRELVRVGDMYREEERPAPDEDRANPLPATRCEYCPEDAPEECTACGGSGWVKPCPTCKGEGILGG